MPEVTEACRNEAPLQRSVEQKHDSAPKTDMLALLQVSFAGFSLAQLRAMVTMSETKAVLFSLSVQGQRFCLTLLVVD